MNNANVRREALRQARLFHEELCAKGDEFTQDHFRNRLKHKLKKFKQAAYQAMVDLVAEQVDKEATHRDAEQFRQGLLFDMDGVYALGKGRRIAKRFAHIDHAQEALGLDDVNLNNVVLANKWKHEELKRLQPFWKDGMTKQEAVAAYNEANPEKEEGAA